LRKNSLFKQIKQFEITDFDMPRGDKRQVLGRGSFGTVYKVTIDKNIRTVKTIDNMDDLIENPVEIANELSVMLLAKHQKILKAFNYKIDHGEDQLQIIMELHGSDLKYFIESNEIKDLNNFALDCLMQTASGLKHAWESLGAVHRD
jgi:serine/threonine protein kinase